MINVPKDKNASDVAKELLQNLQFSIPSGGGAKDYTVKVNLNKEAGKEANRTVYSEETGHIYELIPLSSKKEYKKTTDKDNNNLWSWQSAYGYAKEEHKDGMQGYLATVTSEDERSIINSMVTEDDNSNDVFRTWIGGIRMMSTNSINDKGFYNDDLKSVKANKGNWYWVCGSESNTEIDYSGNW